MLHLPDGVWLVVGGAGLVLAGVLTTVAVLLAWRALVRAFAAAVALELAKSVPTAVDHVPTSKHDKAHLAAVALSERATGIILSAIEDGQVQYARLQNALLLAEWVHAGQNPDAPWAEIVRWKNDKGVTK